MYDKHEKSRTLWKEILSDLPLMATVKSLHHHDIIDAWFNFMITPEQDISEYTLLRTAAEDLRKYLDTIYY